MLPIRIAGFLLLISLMCDADSTCPDNINPLILDPPEIIGEYQTEVYLNCSSIDDDHDGIYWREDNVIETETDYVSKTLKMDWDAEAQCKIKLPENIECSKDLNITVYKNPDGVDMYAVKHVQAAGEETQYELQCDIFNVAPVQNLVVTWYKNNKTIMTDSFTNTTKTPVSESSVLTYNISRGDNGARFKCEAQLDFGPLGPQCPKYSSKIHTVSVHYTPEFKNKTDIDEVYVGEGDNVTLNCEAEGNPPPVFHWTVDRVNINISENTNNLYINQVDASANYSCTASNDLGSITKHIHVHVEKTTMARTTPEPSAAMGCPLTLTPAEIVVRFGDPASINCSTSAADVLGMGWEATVGGVGFQKRLSVPWIVNKLEDWEIKPSCYVTVQLDQQCSVVPVVTLYKTPDKVSISDSDHGPMVEGKERQLTCDIFNVAPLRNLTVKWYRGNETVHTENLNDSSVTPVNVSSTLRVIPKRADHGVHFRCEAELHLGPELIPTASSEPYIAHVHYKPLIRRCSRSYTGVEHQFRIEMMPCQADGNPPPSVAWFKQDREIDSSMSLTRHDSGEYTAKFENIYGTIRTYVNITVEYSASFTCDDHYDVEENAGILTTCKPDGIPPPTVTWFKDGNKVTPPQHWTRHDSGNYLLTATNEHGTANHTLRLNVLYTPEFKNKTDFDEVYVGEGDNVTLNCEAEGNPPPVFHWTVDRVNINILENTNNLYINQVDASANYSCIASNDLGSITKHIHVHVEKTAMAITTPEPSAAMGCPLTLTPAEIVVRFGDPASINCSTSAADVLGMGWEATVGGVGFEKRLSVPWIVNKLEDWEIKPSCYVTVQLDQQCSVVPVVTLYKTPDKVSISDSDHGPMVEGKERQLTCDIFNVAPLRNLTVKWYRGNETVHTENLNDSSVTPVNVSSTLRVIPKRADHGVHFRCEAELHLGPELIPTASSEPYIAHVHYKPLIQSCSRSYTGVEHQFRIEMMPCQADGNPPPSVAWFKQDREIDSSMSLTRHDSGEYTAEFENIYGTIRTYVNITVEYSASFTCDDHYEVEENAGILTTCKPDGIPPPTVTWFKDGNKVTPPQHWTRHDSGNYLLTATNEHGTANHTLRLNVLYTPEFKNETDFDEVYVGEGDNVTLNCEAEGNPPPEIAWKYKSAGNVEETTRGRQKDIRITRATSTNVGVLYCTATNGVGNITRSVTLRMKGVQHPNWFLIVICIMAILAGILFIILIIHIKRRGNKGEYSFIPDRSKDSTNIPMNTMSK